MVFGIGDLLGTLHHREDYRKFSVKECLAAASGIYLLRVRSLCEKMSRSSELSLVLDFLSLKKPKTFRTKNWCWTCVSLQHVV